MKRILTVLLSFVSVLTFAQIRITGNAYQVPNTPAVDYLFVVENASACELSVDPDEAKWYVLQSDGDSVLVASGVNYLYPEHGKTYLVNNTDDSRIVSVAIIEYDSIRLAPDVALENYNSVEEQCKTMYVRLVGDIQPVTYLGTDARRRTIDRKVTLSYHTLSWSGESWQDTILTMPMTMQTIMPVEAPLCNTTFVMSSDSLAMYLNLPVDTLATEEYNAVAVAGHLQTITTIRGTETENRYSNESNRPKEDTQLTGSAPLDILFKANPNKPVATYFNWTVYKGNDEIFHRTEEEHRYTFTETGTYRVNLVVSNAVCMTDTMDTIITVTVSKLKAPNVFTPNGDGKNDEFRVAYESIIQFDCWVYNRWGHMVYHWTDPAKGWDGTINGRPAAVGAYYYIIKAVGADGLKYELRGDINLVGR